MLVSVGRREPGAAGVKGVDVHPEWPPRRSCRASLRRIPRCFSQRAAQLPFGSRVFLISVVPCLVPGTPQRGGDGALTEKWRKWLLPSGLWTVMDGGRTAGLHSHALF